LLARKNSLNATCKNNNSENKNNNSMENKQPDGMKTTTLQNVSKQAKIISCSGKSVPGRRRARPMSDYVVTATDDEIQSIGVGSTEDFSGAAAADAVASQAPTR
jgi:hypothetical protein